MKEILLNHTSDEPQWYESTYTHGETWGFFVLTSPTIYKGNLMGYGWKRQLLSTDMIYKRLHMSKLISKIIN